MSSQIIDSNTSRIFDIAHKVNENALTRTIENNYFLNIGTELASVLTCLIVVIGILCFIRYINECISCWKKECTKYKELDNAKELAITRICHQTILELGKTANIEHIQSELKEIKEKLVELENQLK